VAAAAFLDEGGRTIDETAPWPIRSCKGVEHAESALVADLHVAAASYSGDPRLAGHRPEDPDADAADRHHGRRDHPMPAAVTDQAGHHGRTAPDLIRRDFTPPW